MENTCVTCLYNINRDKIDGRTFDEYCFWLNNTLSINTKFVVFCDETTNNLIEPKNNVKIINKKIEDLHYYTYKDKILNIINSEYFQNHIMNPERIECQSFLYNVIIYSKFELLKEAIKLNPYNSKYFWWIDAGLSRFFQQLDVHKQYPGPKTTNLMNNTHVPKIVLQATVTHYHDLITKKIYDQSTFFDARTWTVGGIFGGNIKGITLLANHIETVFNQMLSMGIINNEQNALGYILKNNPDLFYVWENNHNHQPYQIIQELAK